jgi:hypothetical protein
MESKIALCFLTYGNLSQPKLWENFIDSKYNVYIHNKNDFTGDFKKYCIEDRIETQWGKISLVKATLKLFKTAFKNKENKYFVLLSDKCIPLYSPDKLFEKIKNLDNNLIMSRKVKHRKRFKKLKDKKFFKKKKFTKQHQWMLLKRKTVKFFINNDYTDVFGDRFFAPDEHYFINIMRKYNIPYIKKQITYVNWKEESDLKTHKTHKKHPKTYSNLSNEIVENILKKQTLFMRKVDSECKLPIYFDKIINKNIKE